VVDADAQSGTAFFAYSKQRQQSFPDFLFFELRNTYSPKITYPALGQLNVQRIGKITRIDPDFFYLGSSHFGSLGIEMNIGDQRDFNSLFPYYPANIAQIFGLFGSLCR